MLNLKKKPKKSLKRLHASLDSIFSQYVRLRDCQDTMGILDKGACITCKRVYDFSTLQAGHFVSRAHYAVRYDERNVNSQCPGCNLFKHGALDEYFVALEQKYGREVVDELLSLKHTTKRFKHDELEGLIAFYKGKVKELRK